MVEPSTPDSAPASSALSPPLTAAEAAQLRLEQRYFDSFNAKARLLEAELAASRAEMDAQLAASRAETDSVRHAMDAQRQEHHQQTEELQQQLYQQNLELHQQREELDLRNEQLAQAQEELEFDLTYLDALQHFQHQANHSLKVQLKLMVKTLLRRLVDRLRWLLPADQLRRHKQRLKAVLHKL